MNGDPGLERREFVRLLGMGGVGLLAAASSGGSIFDFLGRMFGPKKPAFGVPEEWLPTLGQPLIGYSAFVGGLQLKHVSVRQVISPHLKVRGDVRCGLPPTAIWKKMRPTLLMLDEMGELLGEDVGEVISAYRSPAYNAKCPGAASGSHHMRNVALDLVFSKSSPRRVAEAAKEVRSRGKFIGGIGRYSNFTHIDTRGEAADWSG
ncbi:MAG: D-Ala-D-Ala carboxypeptidase family metallohydrolase [Chthoniobacterales bacterium]